MWIDGYAVSYGLCLLVTGLVVAATRQADRQIGAGLLGVSWIATLTIQNSTQNLTAPLVMAVGDFALFVGFGVLALRFGQSWAFWAAALHIVALFLHFLQDTGAGGTDFVYLSLLAVVGYATMLLLAVPPIRQMLGMGRELGDNRSSVHPRGVASPLFRSQAKEQKDS